MLSQANVPSWRIMTLKAMGMLADSSKVGDNLLMIKNFKK